MATVDRDPPRGKTPAEHDPAAPAVHVADLTVSYNGHPALRDVTFNVEPGRSVAAVGPNGAGKSTLLMVLAGLLSPIRGGVQIHGHGPCRHICIAYVPQRSGVDWRFPVDVWGAVMMGRTGRRPALRPATRHDRELVRSSLDAVGLLSLARARIGSLSGGQQQRLFIARALAQEAQLILLDEPFAGLDLRSKEDVLGLLARPPLQRLTRIVALHDLGIAAEHFDAVLLLNGTLLAYGPPAEVLAPATLQRAYGSCVRVVETKEGTMVVSDTACGGGEVEHG
jgi:ABC-type Mn2+/Zn2+ transport system ATPase subunit